MKKLPPSKVKRGVNIYRIINAIRVLPLLPVGLFVTLSGTLLLAGVIWQINWDSTNYGKSVDQVLLEPRSGQFMSLGVGLRVIHYLLAGVAMLILGSTVVIIHSVNSLSVNRGELKADYSEASETSESQLSAMITFDVLNHGFFSVTMNKVDVRMMVNRINVPSRVFVEDGYSIPRFSSRQFAVNFKVSGEDADVLHSSREWDIILILKGEASSLFYRSPFHLGVKL